MMRSSCWAKTNQSTFRSASPTAWKTRGKSRSTLIEVRSGAYLEEDDVVRFQDRYGRV
ncbi:Mannose-1-phosphate guanylyltransferase 1 [Kluyvera cryocrescens]|uniref:Mannose-1-phosphate guanylyltransferase 1 n=1 Tax=Kluyvera cryocrescens TaxID=580 RepID=A0A485BY67_KLUCR|nr:Mannose-1-phosphate guanylyltransferase 1 [Kluyvera cryocrescens]